MKGIKEAQSEADADGRHAERAAQISQHLSHQCSNLVVVDITHDRGFLSCGLTADYPNFIWQFR
jgi:hypothetical protein